MTILLTGAIGTVGTQILKHPAGQAPEVRALTPSSKRTGLPGGATPVMGRDAGDDLAMLENRLAAVGPGWLALDLKLMMHRYQTDGAVATAAEVAETAAVLGQTPRSYRPFVEEAAAEWRTG